MGDLWNAWVKVMTKGGGRASHKYIRRVPKAGGGYAYVYGEGHSVPHDVHAGKGFDRRFKAMTEHGPATVMMSTMKGDKGDAVKAALVKNPGHPVLSGGFQFTLTSMHGDDGIVHVTRASKVGDESSRDAVSRLRDRIANHHPGDEVHWGHVGDMTGALHHVDAAAGEDSTDVSKIRHMSAKDAYAHVVKKVNERLRAVHGSEMADKAKHINRALDPHAD